MTMPWRSRLRLRRESESDGAVLVQLGMRRALVGVVAVYVLAILGGWFGGSGWEGVGR